MKQRNLHKLVLLFVLILMFTFAMSACGYVKGLSAEETNITLTGLTGDSSRYNLAEKITIKPSNAKNKNLSYSSSNTAAVTVSANGILQAVSIGTAKITVKSADKKGASLIVNVTVVPLLATSVVPEITEVTIKGIGAQYDISGDFTVMPLTATDKTLSYVSSNTDTVTVNSSGMLTSVAFGSATITATTSDGSNKSAQITVHVRENLVTSVVANVSNVVINGIGNQHNIADDFTVVPLTAPNRTLSYISSDTSVVTVSTSGMLTSVAFGIATVTATSTDGSGKSAQILVYVRPESGENVYFTFVPVSGGIGLFGVILGGDMTYIAYGFKGDPADLMNTDELGYENLERGDYAISGTTITFTPQTGEPHSAILEGGVSLTGAFNFYGTATNMQMQYIDEDDAETFRLFVEFDLASWSPSAPDSLPLGKHIIIMFANQFVLIGTDDLSNIRDLEDIFNGNVTLPQILFAATGTATVSAEGVYSFTYTDTGYGTTTAFYADYMGVRALMGEFVYNAAGGEKNMTFIDASFILGDIWI